MLSSIFRYTSYMILVFGFFYMSWHFGRAYEKGTFDHVAVVSASEQIEQASDCKQIREEIQDYKRIYQEVLKELEEPTQKADLNNKYLEFTKR